MDLVDLIKEIDKFNKETLPLFDGIIDRNLERFNRNISDELKQAVEDLHGVLDRLNKATITFNIPPRKGK